ncbi:hypothetical protein BGP_0692 [Beggiatoa sp. PS]|nr:hypothetical protein BGP_0692 [Beggiatoa sp. PS]
MLDITFYTANGQSPCTVELSETFYSWLAKSDFAKIGQSRDRKVTIEEEEEMLSVVQIKGDNGNRKKFITFFNQAIVCECKLMLDKLEKKPTTTAYQENAYHLNKLYELLDCMKNREYQYLQRA